jgi:hypothetical protein
MTRILAAALVALVVSGPAWADDAVLLHCSGTLLKYFEGNVIRKEPAIRNVRMAKDGSWMEFDSSKMDRILTESGSWFYITEPPRKTDPVLDINFSYGTLFISAVYLKGIKFISRIEAACIPIKNPFVDPNG